MKHAISISCSKGNLEILREFVEKTLHAYTLSEIETHKIILAVDEVCANLIIHANNCNPDQSLELEMMVYPDKEIVFTFRDKGIGFDISQYQEPDMGEIISSKRKGGLGLILVKRIMDKIEFSTEKNHNICRLVKKI
jgi:serine/threonine-protein kinase RsbW